MDVFRGLMMLAMVFANELDMAGIQDVPAWMKHALASDRLTFVDVIAPAFLFIVGMAIPLAIQARRSRGASTGRIWLHILVRTVSLMIIGLYMGNMRATDVVRNSNVYPIGMSHALWSVLLLAGFFLVWNDYPRSDGWKRLLSWCLRLAGVAVLVWLAMIYRQRQGDEFTGMQLRWYVIGTIGWSYLVACVVYFLFRRRPAGMMACLALLIALYIGDREGAFGRWPWLTTFRDWVPLGPLIGAHGSITVAGLIVGTLFTNDSTVETHGRRLRWVLVFALGLFAAGFLLRPLYGLSKMYVTPAWSLYSTGYCCLVFAGLYWITDVWRLRRWAGFALPAGRNPLPPYFLSFMFHPLIIVLGVDWANDYLNAGLVGIARTALVTVFIGVFLTAALTRLGIRLRL